MPRSPTDRSDSPTLGHSVVTFPRCRIAAPYPWVPMRVGILTGGGDCPGLNAVIRAIVRKGMLRHGGDAAALAADPLIAQLYLGAPQPGGSPGA